MSNSPPITWIIFIVTMDLADDDSENDSDYVPGADGDDEIEDTNEDNNKTITDISFSRKRKAKELWEELQQEDRATIDKALRKAVHVVKPPSAKKADANQKLLANIFGSTVAKSISSKVTTKESKANSEDIKKRIRESVENIQKKTTITETRKFAGESIS